MRANHQDGFSSYLLSLLPDSAKNRAASLFIPSRIASHVRVSCRLNVETAHAVSTD